MALKAAFRTVTEIIKHVCCGKNDKRKKESKEKHKMPVYSFKAPV